MTTTTTTTEWKLGLEERYRKLSEATGPRQELPFEFIGKIGESLNWVKWRGGGGGG